MISLLPPVEIASPLLESGNGVSESGSLFGYRYRIVASCNVRFVESY